MQGRALLARGRLRYRTVCGRPMVAPTKVVAVLLHRGCHLGRAASQFFGGQRADGSDGRVHASGGLLSVRTESTQRCARNRMVS